MKGYFVQTIYWIEHEETYTLSYTLNLYTTKCSCMINGKNTLSCFDLDLPQKNKYFKSDNISELSTILAEEIQIVQRLRNERASNSNEIETEDTEISFNGAPLATFPFQKSNINS